MGRFNIYRGMERMTDKIKTAIFAVVTLTALAFVVSIIYSLGVIYGLFI